METRPLIMVIDDDQEILTLLFRILQLEGFSVITAPDYNSALALLNDYTPDLVVLDIRVPGADDLQVLNMVRHRTNAPMIMLTALDEPEPLRQAPFSDADDYVRKPFSARELVVRIRANLARRQMS